MRVSLGVLLAALAVFAGTARGQVNQRGGSHIGYLYPAGGKVASALEVTVGGQSLRGVTDVYVSGEGVRASVIKHYPPLRNIPPEQRQELVKRLQEVRDKRLAELGLQGRVLAFPGMGAAPVRPAARAAVAQQQQQTPQQQQPQQGQPPAADAKPVELPDSPLLRNLDSMDLRQLAHVASVLLDFRTVAKRQMNAQLAEMVLIQVTIDPGAAPGDRELRLATPLGLSNPMCFQVAALPEVLEQEPNEVGALPNLPKPPPLDLPAVLNGQIMPGDVDRFSFQAKQGQRLVIETSARRLVPFLADAVPGWFQATVALYDAQGREVAYADDYRFDPDPVLLYQIPEDGEYALEIHDSIYRGREDFVYRIAVGELPFITQTFPLGARMGSGATAAIDGWNLAGKQLWLDTRAGDDSIRRTAMRGNGRPSNEVTYAVDTLPEITETEPNDDSQSAQRIALPMTVNGRIGRPGDVDVFQFDGRAGDEVVAEVLARRLQSPVDSLVRVIDASGKVLGWNDDSMRKDGDLHPDMGVLTQDADSYVSVRLPADGTYCVRLSDAQDHGGDAYGYRLRISAPRPDFALLIAPSSLSIPAGGAVAVTVHALRKDGFAGDIDLALVYAPAGFTMSGGRIPGGRDHVRMTLSASDTPTAGPVALHLQGSSTIDGKTVSRPVVPSDDEMQAFLYRHLVPSGDLVVAVRRGGFQTLPAQLADPGPVRIPVGGTATVLVRTSRRPGLAAVKLEPSEGPEGVSVQDVRVVPEGLSFQLKVEGAAAKAGFADNLILEAITEAAPPQGAQGAAQPANQRRRVSLGVLPAIPFVVVEG